MFVGIKPLSIIWSKRVSILMLSIVKFAAIKASTNYPTVKVTCSGKRLVLLTKMFPSYELTFELFRLLTKSFVLMVVFPKLMV